MLKTTFHLCNVNLAQFFLSQCILQARKCFARPGEKEQVGTKGGTIGMMDWEETSDDEGKERITISLPMSLEKKDDILSSFKNEWFNILNQNCVRFAFEKLNEVEPTNLDILLYPHQMLYSLTPFYNQDAELERRTQPKQPPTLCDRMIKVLTFIPKILFSVILHVVLICIGGWHRHTYDPDHKNWTNPNSTISYNIFNYENLAIYHSKYLINWMLKQKSLQRFNLTPTKPAFLL